MHAIFSYLIKVVRVLSIFKRTQRTGRFQFDALFEPEELDDVQALPVEVRYVLRRDPTVKNSLKKLLSREGGDQALAIRTLKTTPPAVLAAVNHIATLSQHRCITTWLPQLVEESKAPVYTDDDHARAKARGLDLVAEQETILRESRQFKQFAIIDEDNKSIAPEDIVLVDRMNELIEPLETRYIINRLVFDNAHERTEVSQTIIKILLVVGPITHVLERYAHGIGKVFAASVDDVLSEAAELMALRGSGFTWHELFRRSKILIPVFALATYGVFNVERLIEQERYFLGGAIFGLSAVALSLTTAIQSIRLYMQAVQQLVAENKLLLRARTRRGLRRAIFWEAVRQDFTNPARLGLFLGAIASPIVSMTVFTFFPAILHNGWVLATLGGTETIIAGSTVYLARTINEILFNRKIRQELAHRPQE